MGWPGAPNYALIITGGPKAKAGVPTRIGSLVLGAAPAAFGGPFRSAPQTPPGFELLRSVVMEGKVLKPFWAKC